MPAQPSPTPWQPTWRRDLLLATCLALLLLAAGLALRPTLARAQAPPALRLDISKSLAGSNVVRLGQVLTFTIRITNTGTISVVQAPLFDQFDSSILAFERATPPVTSQPGTGQLAWADLIALFPSLGGALRPGQSIAVVTAFRTVRANVATVNQARLGDALGWGGQARGGGNGQSQAGPRGGRVIVDKRLAPGVVPQVGRPLTFTIDLTNDGAADITRLPLDDTFLPDYLQFASAAPPPSQAAAGTLHWDDILPQLGLTRLRPNEVVRVTTVFTALKAVNGQVVNRAGASGVRDEYGNELPAQRRAEIPIQIVSPDEASATPAPTRTPRPRATSRPETPTSAEMTETATPAATTAPTETAVLATATPTETAVLATAMPTETAVLTSATPTVTATGSLPTQLPRTGAGDGAAGWLLLGVALLLCGGLTLLRRRSPGEE